MSSSKREDKFSRTLAVASRYARLHVRSTYEVRTYLHQRGIPAGVVQRVVAHLLAEGALDDQACARLWADHWARAGYAWAAIQRKLSAKGLSEALIKLAGRGAGRASDDMARAREVVAKPLGSSQRSINRCVRLLRSRGFDQDVIEQVLSEAVGVLPSDIMAGP